jgi:CubicO group peptidase (beta-lactamase class C family)
MNARFSMGSEVAVVLISTGFAWGCSVSQPHVHAAAPVTTSPHKQESARCAELAPLVAPLVEQRWVASASIAIVKNDEKMLCSFGSARGQGSASPDTLYEIGSLTKLFTGVLLAEQAAVGAPSGGCSAPRAVPIPT